MRPHLAIVVAKGSVNGSVAEVARRHSEQLAKKYRVTFLSDSCPPKGSLGAVDVRGFESQEFPILRRFRHVPDHLSFCRAARRALITLHHEAPVSIAWCHSHPVAAWGLLPLQNRLKLRVAMTVHGDIFLRPRGTYDCAQTLLYRIATPRAYARLDFIHVLHPSAIEGVLAKGGRAGCIGVIPNGISMERFSAPKIRNADSPVRFLFVGRLAVEKDPEFLLSVLNKLPAEKRNLELLYVGAGPLEERLCKAVRINGLSQQVKFLGSCSPNQVAKIYADADVVCIPSRSDQFPTVALEALASGTPVIGNRIEGLQHVIKDGVTGWLLPQGDVTAWRDAFLNITSDVPALRGMEKDCRDAAWKSYSWESIGFKLASEVEALLKDEKQ